MVGIEDTLRQFIVATYLPGESLSNVRDETRLLSSGILDSLAVLNLVTFIERTFDIELSAVETSIENFDRIADMARVITRKQAERHAGSPA